MRIAHVVLVALLLGTGVPVALHHHVHGVWNPHQIGIAFFLWLNVIIAFWEICLFLRIDLIEREFEDFRVRYRGRELDRVIDYFGAKVKLSAILSPTTWSQIWSSYAIFDDSYANRKSFGFFIDVGNGFSTLLPSLAFLYGMTYQVFPARLLGIVGILINYQMWYGTLVYFGSYVFNRRYVGHSPRNVAIFVGVSNGLWFTFPLWAIWACLRMIETNTYDVFLH